MTARPVIDLPAPDSPTTPSTSPGAMEKLMSSTAISVPRRVGNSNLEVLDLENHRSFGLSASRSQSPSRLTDSTRITSAAPGNTVIHHSPE